MDTFTTLEAQPVGGRHHHSAQGFCTVCGTAWPCWRGLGEDAVVDASRSSGPPLVALVAAATGATQTTDAGSTWSGGALRAA